MHVLKGLVIAFASYTRIPMPQVDWSAENRRWSMCFFPLIGVVVGGLIWLWLALCDGLHIGPFLRGAIGAVLPLLVTGGIHMDGFMDVTDAMSSWQTKEKRLEILKDSHVGAFAVIACGAYLLLMAGLLSECTAAQGMGLTAAFVLSRSMSAYAMVALPQAKKQGMLADNARNADHHRVRLASWGWFAAAAVAAVCGLGWYGLALPAGALACLGWYAHRAKKYFGGISGDQAGWYVQVTELVGLGLTVLGRML